MTKKGLLAIANNGIEFLIGSLLLVLVTMVYSIEEAGAWIVFLTLLFVGTKFREGITQTSLMKYSVGVNEKQRFSVYWISIGLTIIVELLLGLTAFISATFFIDEPLNFLLRNYIWLALPQALFRLFQFISQSRLDVKSMINSNIVLLNIMSLVLMFVFTNELAFGELPKAISIAYWVGLGWQLLMHNAFSWKLNFKQIQFPEGYLDFAKNGLLRELFGTISSRAYILFTAGLIGYTESALVGIASRYANLIYLPNSAYQGLLYPKACEMVNRGSVQTMFHYYRRAISWMQAGFVPYVSVLISAGSFGIIILHGTEYLASIPFFIVLVLAGAFISPYGHAFGSVSQAAGRPDLVTKVVLINSCLNLSLSYILIVLFGVWGAILSPIITDLIGLFMIQVILRKVFKNRIIESYSNLFNRLLILAKLLKKGVGAKFRGVSA